MPSIGHLLSWIILGGIVGYLVSLLLGERFKGGPLTYIIVGIVTWVVLGIVVKVIWVVLVLAVVILAIAAVVRLVGGL